MRVFVSCLGLLAIVYLGAGCAAPVDEPGSEEPIGEAASRQLELRTESKKLQLAVTVSALEEKLTSGFVIVLEDTSELLRAQKAAAAVSH